ncbi:MAG: hypothetical protein FJY11_02910 [Bacteroidetes bacterium]|nr:hypothetical protein [Bacteroidota bacterium]
MLTHLFHTYKTLPLLVLVVSFIVSCVPESCYQETTSSVKAGFYETGTGLELKADSVTLAAQGSSSDTVYNNVKNLKSIKLFLDPATPGCTWVLTLNGVNDTITFFYESFPHLVSKECGYTIYHKLDRCSFTKNIIDTVIIRNTNITVINEENIRIFL